MRYESRAVTISTQPTGGYRIFGTGNASFLVEECHAQLNMDMGGDMTLATRAFIEFALANSKQRIEEMVLRAARQGDRVIEMPALPCQREHSDDLIKWMRAEGLTVDHKVWMGKPSGLGAGLSEDDELVEYSKYVISF